MQISLFYRKQSPEYHSIEKIFDTVCDNFSDEISFKKIYTKHKSKGLINRLLICFNARKNQSEINHITGDIHFIAPFLKKEQTILTIHDIGIIKSGFFIKRFIIKLFWFAIPFKKVKFVTVISDFTKSEILNNFKINSEKI
ncbi:MAG: hypothetical protein JXR51_10805, partial [Bacteroidales bacterium]|nr:hypothetical protein [Bacteroidales bacterium]